MQGTKSGCFVVLDDDFKRHGDMFLKLLPIFDSTNYGIQFSFKISYLDGTILLAGDACPDNSIKSMTKREVANLNMKQSMTKQNM